MLQRLGEFLAIYGHHITTLLAVGFCALGFIESTALRYALRCVTVAVILGIMCIGIAFSL